MSTYEGELRNLFQRRRSPFSAVRDDNDPRRRLAPLGETHPIPPTINPSLPEVRRQPVTGLPPQPVENPRTPMQRIELGPRLGADASPMDELLAKEVAQVNATRLGTRVQRTDRGFEVLPPERSPSRVRGGFNAAQDAFERSDGLGPWGRLAALVSGGITGAVRPGQVLQRRNEEGLAQTRSQIAGQSRQALEQRKVMAQIDADEALAAQRRRTDVQRPSYFEAHIGDNEYGVDPQTEVRWRQKPDGSTEIVLVGEDGSQRPIVMKSPSRTKQPGLLTNARTIADAQGNKIYVDESGKPIQDPQNPGQPLYAERLQPKPDVSGDLETQISELQAQIDADQKAYEEHDRNVRNKETWWKTQAARAYEAAKAASPLEQRSLRDFEAAAQAADSDFSGGQYEYGKQTRDSLKERLAENRQRIKELQGELRSAKKSGNVAAAPPPPPGVTEESVRADATSKGKDVDAAVRQARAWGWIR